MGAERQQAKPPHALPESDIFQCAEQIMARCEELAKCSDSTSGVSRLCLSPAMARAHELVSEWMADAGMTARVSAIGNISGRREGFSRRTLFVGSHLDTVIDAGRFDGALGVLLGIGIVELLHAHEVNLPYSIEVVGFSDEEGVRFSIPFLGSRVLARSFDPVLLTVDDEHGVTLADAITAFGQDPSTLERTPHRPPPERGEPIGYFEAHIEQGPVLADLGEAIGIVGSIIGQSRARLALVGSTGHAGTVPMRLRRDALVGAAEFICSAERLAIDTPGLVATIGRLELASGAINVIPGSAALTLDVRHVEDTVRAGAVDALLAAAARVATARGLYLTHRQLGEQATVRMDEKLSTLLLAAAGGHAPVLDSGAGHDAMIMAGAMPASMLFVRSPNGISHSPEETVLVEDVARALEVSLNFLLGLAEVESG